MKKSKQFLAFSALLLALAQGAYAAEEPAQLSEVTITAAPPAQNMSYVEPIASTGTKTDTPIMETPLSIQVVPQQVLQDQKATTLDEALKNVSGVRSSNNFGLQESIYLRGFLTTTTFRNGFRIDDSFGNGLQTLTNVESIEVLKGPAAILYGRVEPGGAVNIITKQPQTTPYYSLEQQFGSWDHYLTNLDATGPINEGKTLLYRLNASYDTSSSWRDSVQNEKLFIAPTLQWRISPRTQVTLEGEYTHNPFTYDGAQFVPFDATTNQFVRLPRNQNLAAGSPIPTDTTYLGFNWSHQFNNDWSIKHQFFRREVKSKTDPFFAVLGFTQVSPTAWTVDRFRTFSDSSDTITATVLDLTGHFETFGLKHTLLLGADYHRQETDLNFGYSDFGLPSTTDAFNPTPPFGLIIDPASLQTIKSATDNYGVYLQDQIKFPFGVHVLGGVRYQRVMRTGSITDSTGITTPDPYQSDEAVTPRVGVLWQPYEWLSLYGNYAENFGANTGRDWQGNPLHPESAQQFEAGFKTEFFGGKLRTSLAYFDLTKQNVATSDLDPTHTPGSLIAVGEVRSKGVEFDIQGEILPGWNMIGAFTNTDIRITKSNNGDVGLRMANVPRNMASLWSTYEFQQQMLRGLKFGGGVTGYSSATDSTNTIDTPGYALVNVMASYKFVFDKHKLTAQLNVNNLLDKTYFTDAYVSGNSGGLKYGAPRSYTGSLRYEF